MPRPGPLEAADPRHIGPYRLTGRIGSGGQGIVYLAEDASGTQVAIKLLTARTAANETARRRFRGEIEAARRVAPFCTARILDADVDGDHPYIVSEYIDGISLQDYVMREGPRSGGALDRIAVGTATALAAIHQAGVIHRDFKPQNVLLGVDGLRVIDFGIARLLENTATTSQIIIGTPAYMAPEQIAGETIVPATDMFGWGATIAFAATGRVAFGAESYPAVLGRILYGQPDLDGLTGQLLDLVTACLGKDPAARPTADDVLQALRTGTQTGSVPGRPIAVPDSPARPIAMPDSPAHPIADSSPSPRPVAASDSPAPPDGGEQVSVPVVAEEDSTSRPDDEPPGPEAEQTGSGRVSDVHSDPTEPGRKSGLGSVATAPRRDSDPQHATAPRRDSDPQHATAPPGGEAGDSARRRAYVAVALGTAMLTSLTAVIVALWPTEPAVPIGPAATSAPAVPTPHRATPPVVRTRPVKRPETVAGTTVPATAVPGPSATSAPEPSPSSAPPETTPSSTPAPPPPPPPPPTPEPSASPPPEPEPKPTFAGEWTGTVRRPSGGPAIPIKISLTEASVQGTDTATMSWGFGQRCTARLTRASLTEQQISLSMSDIGGRGCRGGTLVLSGLKNDQASVSIIDPTGTARVSGSVRR
ncbi:protein kinase [Thermopolyspora sp. NPDC052614]|uniref:serine/threonine-protein kinase n=1 Tax=Thermopolyspora sp. NPDC052614 TaxID=3155682 RepID=UPI0034287E56